MFDDNWVLYLFIIMVLFGRDGEIPVVSRQNFTDIKIVWPEKHWAGVNAKTFSDACATPNTWYKMPSGNIVETLANDSRVICLTSVGWDLEGA